MKNKTHTHIEKGENFLMLVTRDGSVIHLKDMQEYELGARASDGSWDIKASGTQFDILSNVNNSLERRLRRHLDEGVLQDLPGETG